MKKKFQSEFTINCSPKVLYPRLSSPGGLSEWFADNVNLEGRFFNFIWKGTSQQAEVLLKKENSYIRFHWLDDEEKHYFEFKITTDELTGDTALIITDFADEDEIEDAKELWETQITKLKHIIGL
jgi:uncharacterized protein YndB with AHSA1/START domain